MTLVELCQADFDALDDAHLPSAFYVAVSLLLHFRAVLDAGCGTVAHCFRHGALDVLAASFAAVWRVCLPSGLQGLLRAKHRLALRVASSPLAVSM